MTSYVNQEVTDALVKSLRAMGLKMMRAGRNRAATSWPDRARRPLIPNGPASVCGDQVTRRRWRRRRGARHRHIRPRCRGPGESPARRPGIRPGPGRRRRLPWPAGSRRWPGRSSRSGRRTRDRSYGRPPARARRYRRSSRRAPSLGPPDGLGRRDRVGGQPLGPDGRGELRSRAGPGQGQRRPDRCPAAVAAAGARGVTAAAGMVTALGIASLPFGILLGLALYFSALRLPRPGWMALVLAVERRWVRRWCIRRLRTPVVEQSLTTQREGFHRRDDLRQARLGVESERVAEDAAYAEPQLRHILGLERLGDEAAEAHGRVDTAVRASLVVQCPPKLSRWHPLAGSAGTGAGASSLRSRAVA